MKVLIVDDSVVFRSQIKSALESVPGIEVTGTAQNGRFALQRLSQVPADLVIVDMEMPEMDGPQTIKEIKAAKYPVKIIVFSAHTARGSMAAIEALSAGAHDFVTKPTGDDLTPDNAAERIKRELVPKILQFAPANVNQVSTIGGIKKDLSLFRPSVVVIAASTGGPPALEKILSNLEPPLTVPILIAQHMPPVFTASLARRLQDVSGIASAEAVDGEELKPNRVYIAPGNYHMRLAKNVNTVHVKLDQGPPRHSVRPAADNLFESAAEVFGNRVLSIVLTGMGEDGAAGSRLIKEKGGGVAIQDQSSCVVFGMPGAVAKSGAFDLMTDLSTINLLLKKVTK